MQKVQLNQIWECGPHRLGIGDCTNKEFVNKLLGSNVVSAIITDPPYGVNYSEGKRNLVEIAKDRDIINDDISDEKKYEEFTLKYLENILPYLNSKNSIYLFNGDKMMCPIRHVFTKLNIHFSQLLVWVKQQPVMGRKDYLLQHELIYVGWYGKHKWNGSKDKSVLFFPKPSKSPLHPSTKPIPLVGKLILNTTDIDEYVYDPFLGSGTTLIACEKLQRKCIGVEMDLEYGQVILDRWSKLTNKLPKLIYEKEGSTQT